MTATTHDAPGLSGPPDDNFSELAWESSVEKVANRLTRNADHLELIELLSDYEMSHALSAAIRALGEQHKMVELLKRLQTECKSLCEAVLAEYNRPEEA